MPHWEYSLKDVNPDTTAKASGRDLDISFKAAYEICKAIRGMMLDKAIDLLEDVIALKKPIPFTRYNKKVPHRKGLRKWPAGRYPVKAAKHILKILESVRANAEEKGLDVDRLKIIHAAAHKSIKLKRFFPRAFGRTSPKVKQLVHVEVIVEEQ